MNIREFRSDDYAAVLDIYALSKLDELKFEGRPFDLIPLDQDPKRLQSFKESRVFVCEDGEVIGYAAHQGPEISALFVHPAARGRGVGKRLLEFLLRDMPGVVSLHVARSNVIAKSLYAQYGFEVVAEFETSYAGEAVMANTMRRHASQRPGIDAGPRMIEIASAEVRAIPIEDCGEPLVDVGRGSTIGFGGPPECPETAPHYRLLREGVVNRLERAQGRLPEGLRFRLYEGYRSPTIQDQLFQAQLRKVSSEHPAWPRERCFLEALKLASPFFTHAGDPITPPHSTGGAIDMEIVDATGAVLDFGMQVKDWNLVEPEWCATRCPGISADAQRHRLMLVSVLQSEGFVNYPREWWHFSFGDQYWAASLGRAVAIYGRV